VRRFLCDPATKRGAGTEAVGGGSGGAVSWGLGQLPQLAQGLPQLAQGLPQLAQGLPQLAAQGLGQLAPQIPPETLDTLGRWAGGGGGGEVEATLPSEMVRACAPDRGCATLAVSGCHLCRDKDAESHINAFSLALV
jgi:X-X-X-Leu-X-X-Gly heptad repeat protein